MLNIKSSSRVKFPKGKQKEFLEQALSVLDISQSNLAKLSNICDRSLRDWKREKYNMRFGALKTICNKMEIDLPQNIKILPERWSIKKASKIGGRRYVELYGSPGTLEGRRKGGIITQKKFRSDPTFAKRIGFILRKEIKCPKKSPALAEFIGIMLGDGGVHNNYQISISFNYKEDLKYAHYIQKLIAKLFCVSSTVTIREKHGSGDIVVSSKNLVEFLCQHGIKKGNKIAGKIDIPKWIWSSEEYKIACLRGLVDTDGGLYYHRYVVNGKEYVYLKMCFTSYSPPLLKSATTILEDLGLSPKNTAKNRAYLYSSLQLHRYFRKVGTSNPRYLDIYDNFVTT